MCRSALIIGSGNSTELLLNYGFDKIPDDVDAYCCSLAFRYCEELNWWPEYYVSLDPKTNYDQRDNFNRLISDPDNPVLKWYMFTHNDWFVEFDDPHGNIIAARWEKTGAGAFYYALKSGKYSKIMMIGLDNNSWWDSSLLEKVNDGKKSNNRFRYIKDVDKHPMYFWPGYIKKGDIVTWNYRSRKQKTYHDNVPKRIDEYILEAENAGIEVVDFSDNKLNTNKTKDIGFHLGRKLEE